MPALTGLTDLPLIISSVYLLLVMLTKREEFTGTYEFISLRPPSRMFTPSSRSLNTPRCNGTLHIYNTITQSRVGWISPWEV